MKRCFDLILAIFALVVLSPLLAGVALAIKVTSRGPVLFRQARVGRNRVPFIILKFRTMTHQTEQTGPSVTRHGDPRLTPLGGFLRRSKLDELPQLLNVLWGEMSFVGPRPKLAHHETMSMPCRPGITGAATIVFCDEEKMLAHIPEPLVEQHALAVFNPIKVKLDEEYQRTATFGTDVWILARTVLRRRKAMVVEPLPPAIEGQRATQRGMDRKFDNFRAGDPLLD
jgi:lipopolysaccharide/colanic/teichoic acid biosynthesis glycosyltransferase